MSDIIKGNSGGGTIALLCLVIITIISFLAPAAAGCGFLLASCVALAPAFPKGGGNGMGQAVVLGPLALVGLFTGVIAFLVCAMLTVVMIGAITGTGKVNG